MTHHTPIIAEALSESNAIEGIYTSDALEDSLKAWEFMTDCDFIPNVDTIEFVHWLITYRQLPSGERGTLRYGREVSIAGRPGMSSFIVRDALQQWIRDLDVMSPKEAHIRFEKIHPFIDGNGRTGRMIYYWQLTLLDMLTKSRVIRSSNKESYYKWFK